MTWVWLDLFYPEVVYTHSVCSDCVEANQTEFLVGRNHGVSRGNTLPVHKYHHTRYLANEKYGFRPYKTVYFPQKIMFILQIRSTINV